MVCAVTKTRVKKCAARLALLVAISCSVAPASTAWAAVCPAEQFGAAVDHSGAALRAFNADAQPKLNERIKDLKIKKAWPDEGYQEAAYNYLQDARMAQFDAHSNDLLGKIDSLGRQGEKGGADCAALDELKAAGSELLGVMKAKSAYLLERIDAELGTTVAAAPLVPAPAKPAAKTDAPAPKTKSADPPGWSSKTTGLESPAESAPNLRDPPAADAYVAPPLPPADFSADEGGYSIEEIRDATRGFFGTISTNLATVLEHTFSIAGRPTGYVLGQEGGGAFLAGLRYGDGILYMRAGGSQKVYWHGPTIGADIGAAGSRTLFLIYKLQDPADIYRSFTGLDGSAYFVGGIGVTLMKGGKVIMAPIRSGLGIRLGANIGYIRFTGQPTWNPF